MGRKKRKTSSKISRKEFCGSGLVILHGKEPGTRMKKKMTGMKFARFEIRKESLVSTKMTMMMKIQMKRSARISIVRKMRTKMMTVHVGTSGKGAGKHREYL
jgi:hypothetical protein